MSNRRGEIKGGLCAQVVGKHPSGQKIKAQHPGRRNEYQDKNGDNYGAR